MHALRQILWEFKRQNQSPEGVWPRERPCKRAQNATLREELKQLRQELVKANSRPIVQNMNVLCFGNEPGVPEAVLLRLIQTPSTAIAEYVRNKHFVKPETKNIRIPNKAKNIAQVVKDKKWQDVTKSEVVEDVLDSAVGDLVSVFTEGDCRLVGPLYQPP